MEILADGLMEGDCAESARAREFKVKPANRDLRDLNLSGSGKKTSS